MKKYINKLVFLALILNFLPLFSATRWEGNKPEIGKDPQTWIELLDSLLEKELYHSAMATASRMLIFFDDIKSKEAAYIAIIKISDEGYSFPTRKLYVTGDIEPTIGYSFVNSYNLYKGIVNKEGALDKWADHYFNKVDKVSFHKYLLYKAIREYEDNEPHKALYTLESILKKKFSLKDVAFVKKVTRMMARIYFELEDYNKSLDIYENFLLKTNPVKASDWLEAAWSFYHLKKYDKALGALYNLESYTFNEVTILEKFVLRALIFRELCDSTHMEGLVSSFAQNFKGVINGIKVGEPLASFTELNLLSSEQHAKFFQYNYTQKKLSEELNHFTTEENLHKELLNYIVETENKILIKNAKLFEDESRLQSVKHLIILFENLKFLKFDVELEKFSPSAVFMEKKKDNLNSGKSKNPFSFYWPQTGDFWADERINFKGRVKSRCQK